MAWTLHVPGADDPWRILGARPAVPPRVATSFWMVAIMAAAMVLVPGQEGPAIWVAAAGMGATTGLLLWLGWRRLAQVPWRPGADRIARVLTTRHGIEILGWWHVVRVRADGARVEGNAVVLRSTPPVHIRTGRGLAGHDRARMLLHLLESA